jgi:hypothetical protein
VCGCVCVDGFKARSLACATYALSLHRRRTLALFGVRVEEFAGV